MAFSLFKGRRATKRKKSAASSQSDTEPQLFPMEIYDEIRTRAEGRSGVRQLAPSNQLLFRFIAILYDKSRVWGEGREERREERRGEEKGTGYPGRKRKDIRATVRFTFITYILPYTRTRIGRERYYIYKIR